MPSALHEKAKNMKLVRLFLFFFTCKAMVPVWKWTQIQIDWLILHKLS